MKTYLRIIVILLLGHISPPLSLTTCRLENNSFSNKVDDPIFEEVIQLMNVNVYFCCGSYDACTIVPSIFNQLTSFLSKSGQFEFDINENSVRIRDHRENLKTFRKFFTRQEDTFRKQNMKKVKLKEGGMIYRPCSN